MVPKFVEWDVFPVGGAVSVSLGQGAHTIFIDGKGIVYACGNNGAGQLGIGTAGGSSALPVPMMWTTQTPFPAGGCSKAATGSDHTCMLCGNGTAVYCVGSNASGQLGANITDRLTPVPNPVRVNYTLFNETSITDIASGFSHTCALGGVRVYCWGSNANQRLGQALSLSFSLKPLRVTAAGLPFFSRIGAGTDHTMAIANTTGAPWGWGSNQYGQLGNGGFGVADNPPGAVVWGTPGPSMPFGGMAMIVGGARHTLAIGVNTVLYAWGDNNADQLGNATGTNQPKPVLVTTGAFFKAVGAGQLFSVGLSTTGIVYTWGFNSVGQLGQGSLLPTQSATLLAVSLPVVIGLGAQNKHVTVLIAAPSVSSTPSNTKTPSRTPSSSPTPSQTATSTPTRTPSVSVTPSPSVTATPSTTPSVTASPSVTATPSASASPSVTSSISLSRSVSPSVTPTPSNTATPSISSTPSATASTSLSGTLTPSRTTSPPSSISMTASVTKTRTPSGTAFPSATISDSQTASVSATPSDTSTASTTITPSGSSSVTPSVTASASTTPSSTPSTSSSPTISDSRTASVSPTRSATASASSTVTPTSSPSVTPSTTTTASSSATPTISTSNTASNTASLSVGASASRTESNTPTISLTSSPSISATASVTSTVTATSSTTASITASVTASPSDSGTPSVTATTSTTSSCSTSPSLSLSSSTSPSPSPTCSEAPSQTISHTSSQTPSETSSQTPSVTRTASPSDSTSLSSSLSLAPSASGSVSSSDTVFPSQTATSSASLSVTTSLSPSSTASSTTSATISSTPSSTPSSTKSTSFSTSHSESSTVTATSSWTPSSSVSPLPSETGTRSESFTASRSSSSSVTPSATPGQTPTASPSRTCGTLPAGAIPVGGALTTAVVGATKSVICDEPDAAPFESVLACTPLGWSVAPAVACVAALSCVGDGGFYQSGQCLACPNGAFCPGGTRLWPEPGFWSESEDVVPFACRNRAACLGAATVDEPRTDGAEGRETRRCASGYSGLYCSECAVGFYGTYESCIACPTNPVANVIVIALAAVALYTLMALGVALLSPQRLSVLVGTLVAIQQLTLVGRIAATKLATQPVLAAGLNYLSVLSFDIEFASIECTTRSYIGFVTLFWATLVMAAGVSALFVMAALARAAVLSRRRPARRGQGPSADIPSLSDDVRQTNDIPKPIDDEAGTSFGGFFRRRATRAVVIAGTVFYTMLCSRVFQGLACVRDPTGTQLLRVQLGVKCFEGEHLKAAPVLVLLLVLFCVGFPVLCCIVLVRFYRRGELEMPENNKRWGSLYSSMQPRYFWFKIRTFVTTFVVTCVAAVSDEAAPRLLTSGVMFAASFVLIVFLAPYASPRMNVVWGLLALAKTLVPFVLLGIDDPTSPHFRAFVALGSIVCCLMIAVLLCRHVGRNPCCSPLCRFCRDSRRFAEGSDDEMATVDLADYDVGLDIDAPAGWKASYLANAREDAHGDVAEMGDADMNVAQDVANAAA